MITQSPAFQFTMNDISRTREESKALVDSLSVLYKHVQQKGKQVKATAESRIDKVIPAFVTCDKCHAIFGHHLEAYVHEELCTLDYKPGTAILDEDFVNRWTRLKLLNGEDCWICVSCQYLVQSLTKSCPCCKRTISFVPLEKEEFDAFIMNQRKSGNPVWQRKSLRLKLLQNIVEGLLSHEHGWVFAEPVDPDVLGIENYFDIIEHPMDLGTVKKRLEGGLYENENRAIADVILTFDNAMLYNEKRSLVHKMAKTPKDKFSGELARLKCVM